MNQDQDDKIVYSVHTPQVEQGNVEGSGRNNARFDALQTQVYDFVFQLLDAEIELSGMDAGKIATETAKRFRASVYERMEQGHAS